MKEKTTQRFFLNLPWLFQQFTKRKFLFYELIISGFVVNLLILAIPIFLQVIFDKVIVYRTISTLNILAISIIILLVFNALLNFFRSYLLACLTSSIDVQLALNIFKHLIYLPLNFFHQKEIGDITKDMLQVEQVRSFFLKRLPEAIINIISICVFLPVLFFYSFKLTLIVLIFSILIALSVAFIIKPLYVFVNEMYTTESKRQSVLTEVLKSIKTIKSLVLEKNRTKLWDSLSIKTIIYSFQVEKLSIFSRNGISLLERMMTLTILWVGVQNVFNGSMTMGALLAFQLIAGSNISTALIRIVEMANDYQRLLLAMQKINNILRQDQEFSDNTKKIVFNSQLKSIEFRNVSFSYDLERGTAISDISFNIDKGETVGIVGISGSGKSTLINLMQGMYLPQTGSILFNQQDIRNFDIYSLRKRFGIVIQDDNLFSDTIINNIRITQPDATIDEIKFVAEISNAHKFIEALPHGYDTVLGDRGVNLSGGQRQRIAIARAILAKPDILILDEATNALDIANESNLYKNLKDHFKDTILIVISHRLSVLSNTDKIIILKDGMIENIGSHNNLISASESYKDLWEKHLRTLQAM